MQRITDFSPRELSDYSDFTSVSQLSTLRKTAASLKNKKIYEINSTSEGGGVAELLSAQMPIYKDLGLDAEWLVIDPNEVFFKITKTLHNCLQGICKPPRSAELDNYQEYLVQSAKDIPLDGDIYVLHDPQTLGLAPLLKDKHLIWRCHIDLTQANHDILAWVTQFYDYFDKIVFSLKDYSKDVGTNTAVIIQPSIDPLSDKNRPLGQAIIIDKLKYHMIDPDKPYLLQVSRFDKFKNPLGVIDIFTKIHNDLPDTQLVLVGGYASDDPEGKPYYQQVLAKAKSINSKAIKIINDIDDVSVNALQRGASVVLQNSIKEGFGLTVTEALWKHKIVFSRPVGGITTQIVDGKTGFYLSDDDNICAQQISKVLINTSSYLDIGRNAKALVRSKFLTPGMVGKYLELYSEVVN